MGNMHSYVVVKECKPNGLGDMLITIKDPTDTAKASLHNKVLSDREFGSDIGVGSVLLLKEVAIFRPFGYLNITLRNIVKVFKYDITHPTEEEVQTSMPVVNDHKTVIEDEACEVRVFGAFSCSIQAVVGKFVLFFLFCDFGALIGS
ncbi:hypothetical protein DEO72_LG10g4198 [Vigna unguiculata]|uniref:Homologous recombination OB-fold protein OB-fold domain-containing protein n=1 Tax=Vigna unguiculata TaxID=3917 RepID=A0A4D6NM49_VIGUN|nr:hypothetical protein DEO72_LG10g4198 [Vigna unguiculata]